MNTSAAVELEKIRFDKYDRYIEVILGKGMSLMDFNPEITCLLNDPNTDLINFYRNIQEPSLYEELDSFSKQWKLIGRFCEFSSEEIYMAFQDYDNEIISSDDVGFMIRAIIMMNMNHDEFIPLVEQKFVVSIDMFANSLIKSVVNTLLKLKGDKLNSEKIYFDQNLETGFKSGFYDHFKNLVNMQKTDIIDCITLTKHLACWFFIKELAKGQHLHYDLNGNLKNHYGGAAFNSIDFQENIKQVFNPEFLSKLNRSQLFNQSPTGFLKEIKVGTNDIVIANLTDLNVVLANGKNYSGINSHIDQVKQIVTMNINLVVITDNETLADEIENISNNTLLVSNNDDLFYLKKFNN